MGREEDAKSQRGVQILGENELREVSKVEDAAVVIVMSTMYRFILL